MTTLTWSSEQIQTEFADCENLKDIISSVENRMWKNGEVVCGISVNGYALSEEQESQFSGSNINEIRELKIESNRPEALVSQTLESISDCLPDLVAQTDKVAGEFRNVKAKEASVVVSELLESFRWFTDAVFLVRMQLEGWAEVEENLNLWRQTEEKHSKVFKGLIAAFEAGDEILVADVLEYDVADVFEDWRRLIPEVLFCLKGDKLTPVCSKKP